MDKLTIDEVIEHCEKVVLSLELFQGTNTKTYLEHKQVAEWLKELKGGE